ncbi:MAG: hypothetical protein IPF83_07560 [Rhodanobacteraceae bacterium]|nr:hypothetical protein [Rhodanobacteraceae bacterium]MBK7043334.1 hypothetical protein [Rhodanobacteraceae bacterium]MBP9155165.1 hypothetical protein [Xanthomonadales bacterium]HQW80978.1 hypothetical protein [Pseudomonadota bacterium]
MSMIRVLLLSMSLSLVVTTPCRADWDAKLEAEEQAKREASIREEQVRKAEADAMMAAARAKMDAQITAEKRKTLGTAAQGKSDAEVARRYDAHIAQKAAEANAAMAQARAVLSSGAGAAALKQVTGNSMQEMESMSEAELEAMAAKLEASYGSE